MSSQEVENENMENVEVNKVFTITSSSLQYIQDLRDSRAMIQRKIIVYRELIMLFCLGTE